MELKLYQQETLTTLRRFLEESRLGGPANAFQQLTAEPDLAKRLSSLRHPYKPLDAMPAVPYACLRLPTGGGKTLLAAHSIAVARDAWIEKDYPLVLWLVPSSIIRVQTAEALKNTRHAYRRAMDEAFGGRVRVFDAADFETITPQDIRDNCCIVVATIQTLRVDNTDGRRVYAHNESMEPHFAGVSAKVPALEKKEDGTIKYSFANVLNLHRPLMIVDEAHNAVTKLTHDVQTRVNPCAIIEFSATPRATNNVLYRVTAQELKNEQMIKLPIILGEHETWQNAVNGAVARRAQLAADAEKESEYLRPIILFQAQPKDEEVTVEVLRKHLIEAEQIPEDHIAVATGDQRDLDGIDLADPNSKIECVITVQALKEGWDCPFAYVFCSVAKIQSATAVEQLLGRVLRMPYARRRQNPELNRAYAHVSEVSFGAAAKTLVDKLIDMGFEADEAREAIEPAQGTFDPGLFGAQRRERPAFRHVVAGEATESLKNEAEKHGFALRSASDGKLELESVTRIGAAAEAALTAVLPETERQGFSEAIQQYRIATHDLLSPAELGKSFIIPSLVAEVQGELVFASTDRFMEDHLWSILNYPAVMNDGEFSIRETARSYEIDVDGATINYQFASEDEQLALDIDVAGWTSQNLVVWLDRQLRQPDIHQSQMVRWISDCVHHLTVVRNLPVASLMRCKFILARKLREKITAARQQERDSAYQTALFSEQAKVDISFDLGFAFKDGMYANERRYTGRYRFSKHFLGPDQVPAFDGNEDGEEFKCAQVLDSLPEVEFWARNVARHPNSMKLPTATDFFYPDFVAVLKDGRQFVLEYKGLDRIKNPDSLEKTAVGVLWERTMKGRGVFLTATRIVKGRDIHQQLQDALA